MAQTSKILLKRLFCKYSRQVAGTHHNVCPVRTLLSDAYSCNNKWDERLQTDILNKVDIEDFVLKLQEKFDSEGLVNAIDIDILANKFEQLPRKQLDFAQSLLNKFRQTTECLQMTACTPHALIRGLLKQGEYERLSHILQDKIKYGIFLDPYVANIMMDHFLKKQMYQEAAHVAYDLMHQEDFTHPLSAALSWYSCHMQWRHPPPEPEAEVTEAPAAEQTDEEEEENVIKVNYIQNPYYDDHFDIPHERWLLGKTLLMVARAEPSLKGRSYMLIGCGLYEKFDQGVELMRQWVESKDKLTVCSEAMRDFHERLSSVETSEAPSVVKPPGEITMEDLLPYVTQAQKESYLLQYQELEAELRSSDKIVEDFDLDGALLAHLNTAIKDTESTDIKEQEALFTQWTAQRQEMLNEQIKAYKTALQREDIARRLQEIRERDIKLSYYDNQSRIRHMMARGRKLQELEELFQTEEYLHWAPRS